MSKKATYEILASQYFIEMQMSIAQIAKRLNISEKTLHTWKKDGDWDKKRCRFLKSQYSTNQSLYELLNLVTKKALDDFKLEGIMPEQKTLYFIMNMSDKLSKLKQFESDIAQEKIEQVKETEEKSNDVNKNDDALQKFFRQIIGE